jgi:hypothetical protein
MAAQEEPVAGRRRALDRLGEEELAQLLADVPVLADALRGTGPLAPPAVYRSAPRARRGVPPVSRHVLAQLLATDRGTYALLASLDLFQLRLVGLVSYHGGQLTRDQAAAEVGDDLVDAVVVAAEVLASRLLAEVPADRDGDRDDGGDEVVVRLLPGVPGLVGLPGVAITTELDPVRSDLIGQALRLLGESVPSRKADRVAQLRAVVSDPARIETVRAEMPTAVRELFDLLLQTPVSLESLGGYWYPSDPRYRPPYHRETPLNWLTDRLLAWADRYEDLAFTWLEVQVATRGALYEDWDPVPPGGSPEPLADPGPFAPGSLVRLEALLDRWSRDPAAALKSGGIGVRPVKEAAKALGTEPTEVALLAHLAVALGLLGRVQVGAPSGRGRNRTPATYAWCPTALREAWSAKDPVDRWIAVVAAFVEATTLDETGDGLPNRVDVDPVADAGWTMAGPPQARRAVLEVLRHLPRGTGLAAGDLHQRAWWCHPAVVDTAAAAGVVAALRILGLVPADGPVGLTELGRAVLTDPAQARAEVLSRNEALTVQADRTVMAPPETAPDVVARLERYAELESDAGVRLYRLSEQRIGVALSAGDTADDIEGFLAQGSASDLPQNVRYLLHDVARAHGRLRAGEATSYVLSDDPALLARAAGYKTAKLRVLAPTVAVSSLSRTKLVEILRGRGLALVAEDDAGATVVGGGQVGQPLHGRPTRLSAPRPVLSPPDAVGDLAASLFTTGDGPGILTPPQLWSQM